MKDYNPFDILKQDIVQKYINRTISSFSSEKFIKIDRETIESMVSSSIFWEMVGGTGFLDLAGEAIVKKHITSSLRKYQNEQILYLKKYPEFIKRETKYNLILSTLLWTQFARYNGVGNSYKWVYRLPLKMLKNFSFKKGLEEYATVVYNKNNKIMWTALENPICLMMNELYYNNNRYYENQIKLLLEEIMTIGLKTDDIKDLLDIPFPTLLDNKSIRHIVCKEFITIKKYEENVQHNIISLNEIVKEAESVRDRLGTSDYENYI